MRDALAGRRGMYAALAAVALVALALRLFGTDVRTLTWDEAYHLRLAQMPDVGSMLGAILANPPSDPLYALVLRGWIGLTGTSDAVMRLPSVLAGAATALAAAWLGWELTRNRLVAVIAALLVAIAPYAIEFGQEMTLYSFATLWVTLALAAGWRWRRSGRPIHGAAAVIFAIVAVYSHYVAAPILYLAFVLAVGRWSRPPSVSQRSAAFGGVAVLLAWLPWALPMLESWLRSPYARTSLRQPASLAELAGAISQYTSGTGALLEGVRPLQVVGLVAAAVLLGRAWLLGSQRELRGLRYVLVVATIVLIGPWLASVLTGAWLFVPHLLLPILPAVAVVAVAGGLLQRKAWPWPLAAAALAALFVAQVAGLYVDGEHPPHGDDGVGAMAAIINLESAPGEPIFVTPYEIQLVADHYLFRRSAGLPDDIDLTRLYVPTDAQAALDRSLARFDSLASESGRAWLIYRPERDPGGQLLTALAGRGTLVQRGAFEFAALYVVELR